MSQFVINTPDPAKSHAATYALGSSSNKKDDSAIKAKGGGIKHGPPAIQIEMKPPKPPPVPDCGKGILLDKYI